MESKEALLKLESKKDKEILQRFFKTGPGQYGEGDVFIGVKLPPIHKLVKECSETDYKNLKPFFEDQIHEVRMFANLLLVKLYSKAKTVEEKQAIVDFYL